MRPSLILISLLVYGLAAAFVAAALIALLLMTGCSFDPGSVDFAEQQVAVDADPRALDGDSLADLAPQPDLAPPDLAPPLDLAPYPDLAPPPVYFDPGVQADVDRYGCASAICHGSGAYPMPLFAAHPTQMIVDSNYNAVFAETTGGSASKLVTKNLAGSGVSHAGVPDGKRAFQSVTDPTYVAWMRWMSTGAPERAP